jgi:EF hand
VNGRWNRPDKHEDSMKKLMLLTVAIASITTLSLCAADDAAPKKAKKELSADVIKKYDKDGDGKLSKEEMQAYRADMKKAKEAPAK